MISDLDRVAIFLLGSDLILLCFWFTKESRVFIVDNNSSCPGIDEVHNVWAGRWESCDE